MNNAFLEVQNNWKFNGTIGTSIEIEHKCTLYRINKLQLSSNLTPNTEYYTESSPSQ